MNQYKELTVAQAMTVDPITIRSSTSCALAEETMDVSDIRHLPVVDTNNRVLGIISERDLRLARPGDTVADLMTDDVLVVTGENRLREATAVMLRHKVGAIPVVDSGNRLVGIVTQTDIVRLAHDILGGDELSADD